MRFSATLLKKQKRVKDVDFTFEADDELIDSMLSDIMSVACERLDIPHPILLSKHERDFVNFKIVKLLPDDFIETVKFDVFMLQAIIDKKRDDISE